METPDPRSPTPPRYRLWHRASGRHKWRVAAAGEWAPDVLLAMNGVRGGEWMLIADGRDPNEREGGK
jgi:hypothetical protein